MNESTKYAIAAGVYCVIALLFIACSLTAFYGAFQPNSAPALVLITGIFGLLGCAASWAAIHCAKRS